MSITAVNGLRQLPRPVAWVFTAGWARVTAQVGMAEVLLEQDLCADLLVGSSLGAINAAGMTQRHPHLELLRNTWRALGQDSVLASPGTAAVRGFAPRSGRSAREFRTMIAAAIPDGEMQESPSNLVLVASDLESGEPRVLRGGRTINAVVAACALPVLLPPVERDHRFLVDGGLSAAAPLEQALAAGAASIVLLDTGASAVAEESLPAMRWWQIATLAYSHQIRGQLGHALTRVAPRIPVVCISSDSGSYLEFADPDEQFRAGRTAAAASLTGELRHVEPTTPGIYGIPIGLERDPRILPLVHSDRGPPG